MTACGSDDSGSGSDSAAARAQTAAAAPAASSRLDRADGAAFDGARRTIATQCNDRAATLGAVATLESLYEIDPKATGADGTTVREAVTDAAAQLRACANRAMARRLTTVAG